jgi:hypothetical protein
MTIALMQPTGPQDNVRFQQETGYRIGPDFRGIKAVVDGEIIGMVGYDLWTPNSVNMHVLACVPIAMMSPAVVRNVFEYPFVQAGRSVVIGNIPGYNDKCLAITEWLGFKEIYRIKDGWEKGVDMVVKEMRKEDCRWLHE